MPALMIPSAIHNEDCLKTMSALGANSVDFVITSPPYNVNLRSQRNGRYFERSSALVNKYGERYSDALPMDEYFRWQRRVVGELLRVTRGLVFYNVQVLSGNRSALMRLLGTYAGSIKELIIWDKKTAEPAVAERVLNSVFELIVVFDKHHPQKRQFEFANFARGSMGNVIRIPKNTHNRHSAVHSAAFPPALVETLLDAFTQRGDLVYDPFLGTGTTAAACIRLGRRYLGSEIDPVSFRLALEAVRGARPCVAARAAPSPPARV